MERSANNSVAMALSVDSCDDDRVLRKWSTSMGNVKSIERAIEALPPAELAEFRRWYAEFDAAAWDRQIEQDAASGKLDALAAEALADHRAGSARAL
jgi:hypothetical protein